MSIQDQRKLIESIHPFELLSSTTMDNLMSKIDIAYYPNGTLLISPTISSIAFYIIIKGSVTEYIDDEIHNVYSAGDSFDADALIYGKTKAKFVVDEDLICYEVKKEDFLDLMQDKKVQSYFLQDFITRHQQLKEYDQQSDLSPFLISKVSDIFLHVACVVDTDESIYGALKKQQELRAKVIIVKEVDGYSIVTDTNLRQRVLLGENDISKKIGSIASKGLITIDVNDFLFNALLLMTHNAIKRVVVLENEKIVGVLEQLDLLSYFASHSHLVAVQIDKASTLSDLKLLDQDFKNLIITLRAKGVKVRYITKLIATLNFKVYKKVFEMCVEEDLRDKCALIVMGSEGREDQTLRSDQDNALIIQNGIDTELFKAPMMKLNSHLLELGFPKCNGDVMVSNEFWRRNTSSYKELIEKWTYDMSDESVQNLSIFLDAKCVAGDCTLLDELVTYLHSSFHSRDDVLAHIAKAVLNFDTPLSLFSGFVLEKEYNNRLDLKKGGIFALVHGVRTLCLQYEIKATNTIERIKELNNMGVIDKTFATELIESFDTLSSIRLKAMLEAKTIDEANYINPRNLEKNQRDLLKDSFKIINKFKKFMSFHFHLNMVV
ncbi:MULTISPECIES: putative nucleotidyltransferase substrate binding domain-containing protein [unclassified Sulfurimonas]|uniref:putative nucleotidyltransferase substrate binding domain-containing protein n=1 Tax=unclassified Sulfurimonas TaxID=2623549 RepID=UPI0008CE4881|nr:MULTISPECIES: putative nucleotidyltransferase substrate binding domain-containing protein [unclassified Sulfurimonas]MBS4067514.1 CBS domain-containing protein [Sulfurimonas sp.]MDD3854141.1 putative nucleotidyltransferase substrate binding domain-containing protein [Sulfurimonas sp.]OHE05875.1 MAG: cyclic nucleotide-binding protein [Sulfurimonas sp. RIFOXYB12_FULL_35_9]